MAGMTVLTAATREEALALLPRGIYVVRGRGANGLSVAEKVSINN